MLHLPPASSPLRSLFAVADLVEWRRLPSFRQSVASARRMFETDSAIREVFFLTIRANGEIWLVAFGPRGGWSRLFNFGDPLRR